MATDADQKHQYGLDRKTRIFVIDDDPVAIKDLRRIIKKAGHEVSTFTNPVRALARLKNQACDLIISDMKMSYMNGLILLNKAKQIVPNIEIILTTSSPDLKEAVEVTKQGAFYYLPKPFSPDQIRKLIEEALQQSLLFSKNPFVTHDHIKENNAQPVMIGTSPKMLQIGNIIRQIAPSECNIIITGESGTGKELVARAIHYYSSRADKSFVAFNCGALSEELMANELFGHEKEAFTGAKNSKPGLIETANGGTLFLDEIGDMPLSMQTKLLRVIQERELFRVGGTKTIELDIRIVTATAQDMESSVKAGIFRKDLYYRLNVVNIILPPLRERPEDIPALTYYLIKKIAFRMKKEIKSVSQDAMEVLKNYAFPGNVRELENIIERAIAISTGKIIHIRDLPPDIVGLKLHTYKKRKTNLLTLEEMERDYIAHVLSITGGIKTKASEILGIDRSSLWRKMKKYGLH